MASPTTLPATFVAGNVLTAAQMNDLRGAFRVLQFQTVNVTTDQATTSTTLIDLTGASITITPSATSSKIFLILTQTVTGSGSLVNYTRFFRGATALFEETLNDVSVTLASINSATFLDSPNTTSATTYKVQFRTSTGTVTSQNFGFTALEISA
jgi:hypothetical protein